MFSSLYHKFQCFYIPDCKKKYTENSVEVYKYYTNHVNGPYPSYTNITFHNFTDYKEFSCWGYENTMYFDHSVCKLFESVHVDVGAIIVNKAIIR